MNTNDEFIVLNSEHVRSSVPNGRNAHFESVLEQIPIAPMIKRDLKQGSSSKRRVTYDPSSENDSNINLVISVRRLLTS